MGCKRVERKCGQKLSFESFDDRITEVSWAGIGRTVDKCLPDLGSFPKPCCLSESNSLQYQLTPSFSDFVSQTGEVLDSQQSFHPGEMQFQSATGVRDDVIASDTKSPETKLNHGRERQREGSDTHKIASLSATRTKTSLAKICDGGRRR